MISKLNRIFKMMDYTKSEKIKVPWHFSDKYPNKEICDKLTGDNYRPDRYFILDRQGVLTYIGKGDRSKPDITEIFELFDAVLDKVFDRLKETCISNARSAALIRLTNYELTLHELDFLSEEG